MMFTETKLPGSFIIDPERLEDERSFFARTWCQHEFAVHWPQSQLGTMQHFLQYPIRPLRGLHY